MTSGLRRQPASRSLHLLACVLVAACASTTPTRPSDVTTELVEVTTTDGVHLNGALWKPTGGSGTSPALFLVHGYAGNYYTGWPDLAHALAARGYLTLALNLRDHDLTPQRSLFGDNRADIEAGINLLVARGALQVVLVGQSLGTNRVLFYHAETQDTRVRGLVLMAGPGNLFEWNIRTFGRERAFAELTEAERWVEDGRGEELMVVDLGPLGTALYSAKHVVSLRGPKTRSDPFQNIARVKVPILILHGKADRLADATVAERLKGAAVAASSVQLHLISGADHSLPRHTDAILPILAPWLETVSRR